MRFLLDEMYPPQAAVVLREQHGHDAVHVVQVGLGATDDAVIAAVARAERRAMVTENVADFAGERDLVLVFVPKAKLPPGGVRLPFWPACSTAGPAPPPTPTSAPTGRPDRATRNTSGL